MRQLELLAPAKNLACGMAAIDHGADAVYIGAQKFGARAAAGNSLADIEALCHYAHPFAAKVFVTLNTIVYDHEISEMLSLAKELEQIGVDGVMVQDMGLFTLLKEQTSLHLYASTQTDNRTPDKVRWLQAAGFERVVLARELSLDEIAAIHAAAPSLELEAFVHGALCVSYSGRCYASQHCFGRSANRGSCAQFCRLKFDLVDATGQRVAPPAHYLSLKDMSRIDHLEELAEAGVTSFKIEGRLKEVDYVKNVVSAYSTRLNAIVKKYPHKYQRASVGKVSYAFTPNLEKTFNRGFTSYFLHGRSEPIASFHTPKAVGQAVGRVKQRKGNVIVVSSAETFANGDGLCFFNKRNVLEGVRVNRAEGNRLFLLSAPSDLLPGTPLFRNNDEAFGKLLSGKTAERKLTVSLSLTLHPQGFALTATSPLGRVTETLDAPHEAARSPQRDNMERILCKTGNTPFQVDSVDVSPEVENCFIPAAQLTELRRRALLRLSELSPQVAPQVVNHQEAPSVPPPFSAHVPYTENVSNRVAEQFYLSQGATAVDKAFELESPEGKKLVMQCKHCIRYSLGHCTRHGGKQPSWKEPLLLVLPDGRRFPLRFDCKNCQMEVYAE